jgi:hypothetical protein
MNKESIARDRDAFLGLGGAVVMVDSGAFLLGIAMGGQLFQMILTITGLTSIMFGLVIIWAIMSD